jgi:hypothetical protein
MAKVLLCVLLGASPTAAQSSLYSGGAVAADGLDRTGHMQVGATPAVGGFLGWRFADNWSAELHLDRAFGKSSPSRFEELLYTEQTLRSEIYGRTVLVDSAGAGLSALAVWKSPPSGRVRAAVTMGFSMRRFERSISFTRAAGCCGASDDRWLPASGSRLPPGSAELPPRLGRCRWTRATRGIGAWPRADINSSSLTVL